MSCPRSLDPPALAAIPCGPAPAVTQARWRPALHRTLQRSALLLCASLVAAPAQAGTLNLQVLGSDGRAIAQAVAWLESPSARQALSAPQRMEIEQKDRQFTQRVTVVPVGTAIDFPNRDRVRHHVYSVSPAKTFDLQLYIGKPANPVVFDRAGVAVLGCNIHDDMVAWVVAVDTPYFGQSPASGQISLADVPAGRYQLVVWHPNLPVGAPAQAQAVTLGTTAQALQVRLPVLGD